VARAPACPPRCGSSPASRRCRTGPAPCTWPGTPPTAVLDAARAAVGRQLLPPFSRPAAPRPRTAPSGWFLLAGPAGGHPATQPAAGSAPPGRLLVGLAGITPAAADWCSNCGQTRRSCPAAAWGADRRLAVMAPEVVKADPLKLARCWHKPSPLDCSGLRCLTPRTFADLRGLQRLPLAYARLGSADGTANAVRVRALPGFKSPSLRGSRPPPWMLWGGGLLRRRAEASRATARIPVKHQLAGSGAPRSGRPLTHRRGPGGLWASQPGVRVRLGLAAGEVSSVSAGRWAAQRPRAGSGWTRR
jgi:hypothetical protein